MSHDHYDPRVPDKRTPEQLEATRQLAEDAELRQLATAALLVHENPNQSLRRDLQHPNMTNVQYAEAARKVLDERREVANALHQNALKAYHPQNTRQGVYPSVVDQLEARRQKAISEGIEAPTQVEIPTFIENERLEYAGMASLEDVARAGATLPIHRQVLEKGIPLQHQQSANKVIGLPPGDLEMSQDDYTKQRKNDPFAGYAIYKIVKE